ncbi:MBL fold metallo-hydrolase [Thalassotalea agarivorans]|uniref:Glyoxylase, beta-lactamase superfamily II n=1 Tax=Thalassotalea agarivorans TaxID=349064 RepID=A0A1I0BLD3_THASX|nr:MBL fold metallo-hydrolase [Thalassotalea agarivorans]SET07460.1 Glyoxylase, beta-lactamase superfamily II [Thalassotalea agarivorans]
MKLHKIPGYIQTIYLAEYRNKLLLLDGCSRADVSVVIDYIKNTLSRPVEHLDTVVVTHMHPDHAGGATFLRNLTGCKIVTADIAGNWYDGIDGFAMHLTDIWLAKWVAGRMGKKKVPLYYPRILDPDIMLVDREYLPGFSDWQIIYTQGHTDRDISLLHLPTNQIYIADLIVKVKDKFVPPYPIFYPNRYRASIKLLTLLAPTKYLLAHGGEQALSEEQLTKIIEDAPTVPLTHWRSVKGKIRKILGF